MQAVWTHPVGRIPRPHRRQLAAGSLHQHHQHAVVSTAVATSARSDAGIQVLSYSNDPEHAERCVQTLAAALALDPDSGYYIRPGQAFQFFESASRLLLKLFPASPQIISVDDGRCAAVCFAIPRLERANWWALLGADMIKTLTCVRPERLLDSMQAADFFDSKREEFIESQGDTVLYILGIGTQPEHQSKGLGSRALAALCGLADRQQVPMYLEATSERSVSLYQRHGFTVLGKGCAAAGAPTMTFMARLPVTPPDQLQAGPQGSSVEAGQGEGAQADEAEQVQPQGLFSRYAGRSDAAGRGR